MTVLVDTSVLIDHLRGDHAARDALAEAVARGDRLAASVVVKVEILAGMRPEEERLTRRLLDAVEWFPVTDPIAERAGELANRILRSHPGVDPVDYIIAATATLHEAPLWTQNLEHFPVFPDRRAPY
jgi:predicted nucleic acid-binding protein